MRKFLVLFISFIFINSFIFLNITEGVYFASDTVTLYKGKNQINDDNIIFLVRYKTHSEKCKKGICSIGQQYYPVTIYETKNKDTLTFAEFYSRYPHPATYDGRAIDKWYTEISERYLKYLEENSISHLTFDPGPSKGGAGCGWSGCIGGRIGDYRSFVLDVISGEFMEK